MSEVKRPEWKWRREHEPKPGEPPRPPRMGFIGTDPIPETNCRFAVFGGVDGLYHGLVDAKDGDPFYPGPYSDGVTYPDEAAVERAARALFHAYALGCALGKTGLAGIGS